MTSDDLEREREEMQKDNHFAVAQHHRHQCLPSRVVIANPDDHDHLAYIQQGGATQVGTQSLATATPKA